MSKRSIQTQTTLYCGIDVSAKSLNVAIQRVGRPAEQSSFPNSPNGHKALIIWLRKAKSPVRVSLEATGVYSLDLAFALDAAEGIEVAVLNLRSLIDLLKPFDGQKLTRQTPRC